MRDWIFGIGIASVGPGVVDLAIVRHSEEELSQVLERVIYGPGLELSVEELRSQLERWDDAMRPGEVWFSVGPDTLGEGDLGWLRELATTPEHVHECAAASEWTYAVTGRGSATHGQLQAAFGVRLDLTTLPRLDQVGTPALGLALHAVTLGCRARAKRPASSTEARP